MHKKKIIVALTSYFNKPLLFFLTVNLVHLHSFASEDCTHLNDRALHGEPAKGKTSLREYADQLVSNSQASIAVPLYKEILADDPSPEEARLAMLSLAKAYALINEFDAALNEYDELLKLNPNDDEAKKGKGQIYVDFAQYNADKGLHEEAIKWYLKAIESDPDRRLEVLRKYADELSYNSQAHLAIPLYKEILAGNSSPEEKRLTMLSLAQAYAWTNQFEDAFKEYDDLLKLNPNDDDAKRGKGQIYVDFAQYNAGKGQHEEAIKWYEKAIITYPSRRLELLRKYADELSYNAQADLAIPLYKEILADNPSAEEKRLTLFSLARAFLWTGQLESAFKEFDKLLQLIQKNDELKKLWFQTLLDSARYDSARGQNLESLKLYAEVIRRDPSKRRELLREYADELSYNSESQLAVLLYKEILEGNPSAEEKRLTSLSLARAYVWLNQFDKALKEYEKLLNFNRDDGARKLHGLLKEYADQLINNFQTYLAIPIYSAILADSPTPEEAKLIMFSLADAYVLTNQFESALKGYEDLLKLNPNDEEARKRKVQIYFEFARYNADKGQHEEAIKWYTKAIDSDPDRRLAYLRRYADELSYNSQAHLAIPLYKEILAGNPSVEEARLSMLGLARAYAWTNQFDFALNGYDDLLKLNPNDEEAKKGKAQIFVNFAQYNADKGQHEEAIKWYLKAIENDPSRRLELLRRYADELSYNSQAHLAIPFYKEILAGNLSHEEDQLTLLSLARAYVWTNQFEFALKAYDDLLKLNPDDEEAKKGKAQIFVNFAQYNADNGQHEEAIKWYLKAIESDPGMRLELLRKYADELSYNSQAQLAIPLYMEILAGKLSSEEKRLTILGLARAYVWTNQFEFALTTYDDLLKLSPNDAEAKKGQAQIFVNFARHNAENEQHKESIRWFEKAIEYDPVRRMELLREYADQLLYDSQARRSIPLYKEILCGSPSHDESVRTRLSLARAYLWSEQYQEALKEYHQVLVEDPTNKDAIKERKETLEKYKKKISEDEYNKGIKLEKKLEVLRAKRAFEKSIELDPKNNGYREHYAWHLHSYGFLEEAIAQFCVLLPQAKDKRLFYEILGWDLRAVGVLKRSLGAFSHLYAFSRFCTIGNKFNKIINCSDAENHKKAALLISKLHISNDNDFEIRKKLFEIYAYSGKVEKATPLALQILSCRPDEYYVHFLYADMLLKTEHYYRAIREFQSLLGKLPNNAYLFYRLGYAYEQMGRLCEAWGAYETAMQLDNDSRLQRAYARILSKIGFCSEAFAVSNQINCERNNYLTKALSIAEVNRFCGDECRASHYYNEALHYFPYNQEAVWGLLKASSCTGNTCDALLSYRRWQIIYFDNYLKNLWAPHYRPPEVEIDGEYFVNRVKFVRQSLGANYDFYSTNNLRLNEGYFYTRFSQPHFDNISRSTVFLEGDKLFSDRWEFNFRFVVNFYDRIQSLSKSDLRNTSFTHSKGVFNYHLNLGCQVTKQLRLNVEDEYYDVIDTQPAFGNRIYDYTNQIGATALNIRTKDYSASFLYTNDKIYLYGQIVFGKYSDGNDKQVRTFTASYSLSNLPNINLFYGYFYLNFSKPAPIFVQNEHAESAYYDPKNFEAHSASIHADYDFTNKLQVGAETAFLYFPKSNGIGNSAFAYFVYKFTNQFSLRLDLRGFYQNRGVGRFGSTGPYSAANATLQMIYRF